MAEPSDEIYFSNIDLNPHTYYFLYVGELKAHGLNEYVKQSLRKTVKRPVGFVSIIPDLLDEYSPFRNMIVINPVASRMECEEYCRVSMRIPMGEFSRHVTESPYVREVIQDILSRQDELYVWMFESKPEMRLTEIPGVRLLGPKRSLAVQCNNKVWQYDTFRDLIPVVPHRVVQGSARLLNVTDGLRKQWTDGIFITGMYSAAGANSAVTHTQQEVFEKFTEPDGQYLASRYIPHDHDPTVLGVVASAHEVYVAGVADQIIENRNTFRGSTFPSCLPRYLLEDLCDYTRIVGRVLGKLGYRGIFGCDYIVDDTEAIHFVEVNTRKQGTTMEFCCSLELLLPKDAPNLLELEYHAVMHGGFPDSVVRPAHAAHTPPNVFWGTYNYKIENGDTVTKAHWTQQMTERGLFKRVARGGKPGYIILEHVGAHTLVKPGTFMGRVVAVGSTRAEMQDKLFKGKVKLAKSIAQGEPIQTQG